MKYLVDSATMKAVDNYSINAMKIPSVVLMERAALNVTESIIRDIENRMLDSSLVKVVCVCGSGNNGADGIAVARQLKEHGIEVCILLASGSEGTEEYRLQKSIATHLGIRIIADKDAGIFDFKEYNYIIDAIFGIGLSREVQGAYADIINSINEAGKEKCLVERKVVAVDIPSGISADTGKVLGVAVQANWTVTFGYNKLGCVLYPGSKYCGDVHVCDAGFAPVDILDNKENVTKTFIYEMDDLSRLPIRKPDSNKGSYGKVLIVAGSESMGGAAILSARGCEMCGTGLVKVLSHQSNRDALLKHVPECLISTYADSIDEWEFEKSVNWANCMVVGPGLSKDIKAEKLVELATKSVNISRIFDADALNIIAEKDIHIEAGKDKYIVTPHIGEMSRLSGKSIADIKDTIVDTAREYAKNNNCICVLKDARTVVSDGERCFINTSGNDGMSTGGSGDVLTGIMSGLIATGMDTFGAACLAVYAHGCAGDMAADQVGKRALTAMDLADNVGKLFR